MMMAVTPLLPDWPGVPSVSSDIDRAASNPQKMKTAMRKPPSSAAKLLMANGLNHSQENGCTRGSWSRPKMLTTRISAKRKSPPYWMMVRNSVVRDDSSAPRATSQVVVRMNTAAMAICSHFDESSSPTATFTAFTVIPAAPTPASTLDSSSA